MNEGEKPGSFGRRNLVSLLHSFCFLCLLRLLLISHHLELVDLLQFGNFECTVGLTGLHLQVKKMDMEIHNLEMETSESHGTFKIPKLKKVNKFKMMGDEEEAK